MSTDWKFTVSQSGMNVASGTAPAESDAMREAFHYAKMYAQDGPVIVKIFAPHASTILTHLTGPHGRRQP